MLTDRNINKLKYIETKINDIDVIISMITTYKQTNKQKDKQKTISKKTNNGNRLCNKQTCICMVLIQGNEKSLMKIAAVSAQKLKTVKYLSKILFNIYVMVLCFYFLVFIFSLKDDWKVLRKYFCPK